MKGNGNGNGESKPPMRMRPIYVEYVYSRMCRRNPSYDRFGDLPELHQHFLIDRMKERRREAKQSKGK